MNNVLVQGQESRGDASAVITLRGAWTKGNNDGFRAAASNMIREGHRFLVIDVANVHTLDSFALASLVAVYARLKTMQPPGALCLVGVNPDLRDQMAARRVEKILPAYFDLATGLNAVRMEAQPHDD
ncbi:MAG: STAS domain-containing protein [Candidatus Eremiobacterota bacterium]